MGWLDGWPFKSKEQMDKERLDFENRMFPFGLAQKDAALSVIKQGCRSKVKDEEKMFVFIIAKDACMQNGGLEGGGMAQAERVLAEQRWLPEEDRRFIASFLPLEICAPSLEEYPTAEEVFARMN